MLFLRRVAELSSYNSQTVEIRWALYQVRDCRTPKRRLSCDGYTKRSHTLTSDWSIAVSNRWKTI